jgi:Family of unknown function (DUF5709)
MALGYPAPETGKPWCHGPAGGYPEVMSDPYPKPVSDPAANGLPEYADDESTAWDDVESPRVADGPDPAPLPPDREDGPLAVDEYGTTAAEQRRGEPLDLRLAREEPDVPADPVARDSGLDDVPVDPHLGSAVSMYDRPEPGLPGNDRVGRLVEPDEGAHEDTEPDAVAYDAGAAGGGASAEELAVHPVREE